MTGREEIDFAALLIPKEKGKQGKGTEPGDCMSMTLFDIVSHVRLFIRAGIRMAPILQSPISCENLALPYAPMNR